MFSVCWCVVQFPKRREVNVKATQWMSLFIYMFEIILIHYSWLSWLSSQFSLLSKSTVIPFPSSERAAMSRTPKELLRRLRARERGCAGFTEVEGGMEAEEEDRRAEEIYIKSRKQDWTWYIRSPAIYAWYFNFTHSLYTFTLKVKVRWSERMLKTRISTNVTWRWNPDAGLDRVLRDFNQA